MLFSVVWDPVFEGNALILLLVLHKWHHWFLLQSACGSCCCSSLLALTFAFHTGTWKGKGKHFLSLDVSEQSHAANPEICPCQTHSALQRQTRRWSASCVSVLYPHRVSCLAALALEFSGTLSVSLTLHFFYDMRQKQNRNIFTTYHHQRLRLQKELVIKA